jgi:hypothetical protein
MAVLDPLAPDQRAVVGLVLEKGKSYREIADLLGISRSAVRARAHAGLAALAPPTAEVPADEAAQLADYLLGQQDAGDEAATRALIEDSTDARLWATEVAERLREVAPERVPSVGTDAPPPRPRPREPAGPASSGPREPAPPGPREPATSPGPGEPASSGPREPGPRSSKLGGILLIAGTALVVAIVLAIVFLSGGNDDSSDTAGTATPSPTAAPTATPRIVAQVPLSGSGRAKGVLTLFVLDQQLGFQIEGQDMPPNTGQDRYAVWFTGPGNKVQLIGVARDAVGSTGALGVSGPPTEDAAKFPQQLAAHRRVVVSRETQANAKQPGPVVLSGKLPGKSS